MSDRGKSFGSENSLKASHLIRFGCDNSFLTGKREMKFSFVCCRWNDMQDMGDEQPLMGHPTVVD